MATIQAPTDFNLLLGGMPPEQVLQLKQHLDHVYMPTQMRLQNLQKSQLLRLPQELRDNIMRMTIGSEVNIDPLNIAASARTAPPVAWTSVCTQLRLDAAQVYFSTPIYLPYVRDAQFKQWTDSIDERYRCFVRSVHVDRFVGDYDQARGQAASNDAVGRFKEGTVWVPTSVGEIGSSTSIWINALGETKPYEEVLPLEACMNSAISDTLDDICGWT